MKVTAKEHGLQYEVFLDSRNVTDVCIDADDEFGMAMLLLLNDQGEPYLSDQGEVAKETLTGKVEIVPVGRERDRACIADASQIILPGTGQGGRHCC